MPTSTWPALFNHPIFRKAWEHHLQHRPWDEAQNDNIIYIFGRLMAAESRMPLPRYTGFNHLTGEMVDIIKRCPEFEKQMLTSQMLQTLAAKNADIFSSSPGEWIEAFRKAGAADLNQFLEEHGVKQGDER